MPNELQTMDAPLWELSEASRELRELLTAEVGADGEPLDQADKDAIQNALALVVRSSLKKVDSIGHVDRDFTAHVEALKEEKGRIETAIRRWEGRQARLRTMLHQVMVQFGHTKLEGSSITISLRNSPPSLDKEIDEAILPRDLMTYSLELTSTQVGALASALKIAAQNAVSQEQGNLFFRLHQELPSRVSKQPKTAEIKEKLMEKGPCPTCKGAKKVQPVCDCIPKDQEEQELPIEMGHLQGCALMGKPVPCQNCGAKGVVYIGVVPGARLITSNTFLQIK